MTDLEKVTASVEAHKDTLIDTAKKIWEWAELPYAETKSAALLESLLEKEGFAIESGVADIPTAFTARWGQGSPVMGFLGEYDALDILSQQAGVAVKRPVVEGAPGHGCGHNLLGTGAAGAAIALKEYLEEKDRPGTVIFFGCPAEEGAGSKQFMARAGVFDGTDFIYTWHPGTVTEVGSHCSVAIMGANFEFSGVTSHAGGSPHLGRSALDAAELMSVGVNYLREHMIDQARIHYAYADAGGVSPNVVQDHSLIKYEVRSPRVHQVKELFERVVDVARGAALMTGTAMSCEITMAFSDYIPNVALAEVADACLKEVGAPKWDEQDYKTAKDFLSSYNETTLDAIRERMRETYGKEEAEAMFANPLDSTVHSFDGKNMSYTSGSTDVGDVGYVVPTLNMNVETACVGNVGHTWQMTGFSGSAIGMKGMIVAAKALALSAIRTAGMPAVIARAKELVAEQNGGKYECPLPDSVAPPIGKY